MEFRYFGSEEAPLVMLIPGLGVSHEIFAPLVGLLEGRFRIVALEVDGFILDKYSRFTSIDDQAREAIRHIQTYHNGHVACAYGISMGGTILSRILERGEITIDHAILDAAPIYPLPRVLLGPFGFIQSVNMWTTYHQRGIWKRVLRSHYLGTLFRECRKVYPFGGRRAVLEGYKAVYSNKLESITAHDLHYWYGNLEAFAIRPHARHLQTLHPEVKVEVFKGLYHGQLLIDHPDKVAERIERMVSK